MGQSAKRLLKEGYGRCVWALGYMRVASVREPRSSR